LLPFLPPTRLDRIFLTMQCEATDEATDELTSRFIRTI
jgi:hypothetical protein